MDRLKALEIFKSVAERGSFVRAADALNLAAPAVTRAVQDLERLLGVRLLQRTTRSVVLTSEGKDVLDRARGLLSSFEELEAISSARSLEVAGDIRLSAPVSFGVRRLGPILASFTSKYPKARIDLQLTDVAANLIESGVDLALRISRELPDSLVARPQRRPRRLQFARVPSAKGCSGAPVGTSSARMPELRRRAQRKPVDLDAPALGGTLRAPSAGRPEHEQRRRASGRCGARHGSGAVAELPR